MKQSDAVRTTTISRHTKSRRSRPQRRLARLTWTLLATIIGPVAVAAPPPNTILPGNNGTTVTVSGKTTDIRTTVVQGSDAFNTFTQFQVSAGNIVNLRLPANTNTLVNLVTGGPISISGTVDSLLSNGRLGGNVIFADPFGFMVSSTGVLNVGSLLVATPDSAGMSRLLNASQGTDSQAVSDLMSGKLGTSSTGSISIAGTVNSMGDVTLYGGAGSAGLPGVDVTGTIRAGSAGMAAAAVNVGGMAGVNLVNQSGSITLVSAGDVHVAGSLITTSNAFTQAGAIRITAGQSIALDGTSVLNAQGQSNEGGGAINLTSGNNITLSQGTQVVASAAGSGAGGQIEISAPGTVTLGGGLLQSSSASGAMGTVTIDPSDVNITGNEGSAGTNFTMSGTAGITVAAGATISTVAASNTPNLRSGDITLSAPNINISGTLDASALAGSGITSATTAGNIMLNATAAGTNNPGQITLSQGSKLLAKPANNGSGIASTGGTITLSVDNEVTGESFVVNGSGGISISGATISGDTINLSAVALGKYSWDGSTEADMVMGTADKAPSYLLTALAGVDVQVDEASSAATIAISGNSALTAVHNLNITAYSTASAKTYTVASPSSKAGNIIGAGFMYGQSNSTATIDVGDTTSLTAQNLTLDARNTDDLDNAVYAFSKNGVVDAAIAVSIANVTARANIASGVTVNVNGNVSVFAGNNDRFVTSASAMALDAGQAGLAFAYFNGNTSASATVGANINTSGSITIQSLDDTVENKTTAGATVGSGTVVSAVEKGAAGVSGANAGTSGLFGPNSPIGQATSEVKGAGAATVVIYSQNSTADIGAGTQIKASDVIVDSQTSDQFIQNQATSSVNSNSAMPTAQMPAASYSASLDVSYGDYTHNSTADIGDDASVTAQRVAVNSLVNVPYSETFTKWEGLASIESKVNGTLGLANNVLSGYSNSTGGGDNGAIAGSVQYLGFVNDSQAYIGQNANVTVVPGGAANWTPSLFDVGTYFSTALSNAYLGTDTMSWFTDANNTTYATATRDFSAGNVVVLANTNIGSVNVAGNLGLSGKGTQGQNGGGSLGGAYSQTDYTDTTVAFIAKGAVIDASSPGLSVDLAVKATSNEMLIQVDPSSGTGASFGFNGILSQANFNDDTVAAISNQAAVKDASSVTVAAYDAPLVLSVGAAINSSDTASIGVGVATINATGIVQSYVGNDNILLTDANDSGSLNAAPVADNNTIAANNVQITARNEGYFVTGAIAGSKSTSGGEPTTRPRSNATASADSVASGKSMFNPPFQLGVAGASTVNTVNLTTQAYAQNATITSLGTSANSASALTVSAVNNTDLLTLAGAAASATAGFSIETPPQGEAALAGALALNDITDSTNAYIDASSVTGMHNITVDALAGGQVLSMGLGMALASNSSSDPNFSLSLAGSFSYTNVSSDTTATVDGSNLTGDSGVWTSTPGTMSVQAYDRSLLGTGAGSLSKSGSLGIGGSVSYADINDTAAALVNNSTLTSTDAVTVQGENATKIASAGASVALANGSNSTGPGVAFSGVIVLNNITNETSGEVTGNSKITASKSVLVAGNDTTGDASLDSILDSTRPANTPDSSVLDYSAAGVGLPADTGSSIIAVAGNVDVSKGGNVGISFTQNTVSDGFDAEVDDSSIVVNGSAGAINVSAHSAAGIFAVAFGVSSSSQSFAGAGSNSVASITNHVNAEINSTAATAPAITASSIGVNADDGSDIEALAGQVVLATSGAALGETLTQNTISNIVSADVSGVAFNASSTGSITAANNSTIKTLSVSGGYSKTLDLDGAVSTAQINNTTTSTLLDSSINQTGLVLNMSATDSATIESLAAAVAVATSGNGFGVAVAYNSIGDTTSVEVGDASTSDSRAISLGSLNMSASNTATVDTFAAGVAASNGIGGAGSTATSLLDNSNTATIDKHADVQAINSIGVEASSSNSVGVIAGAVGIGTGNAGVGLSVVVNEITGNTSASISGATVDANGASTANEVTLDSGDLLSPPDLSSIQAPGDVPNSLGDSTSSVRGLVVSAVSGESVEANAATLGIGQNVGVALVPVINLIGGTASATITNSQVDTRLSGDPLVGGFVAPELDVVAYNHAIAGDFVAALGGGKLGAAGAASSSNVSTDVTSGISGSNVGTMYTKTVTGSPQITTSTSNGAAGSSSTPNGGGDSGTPPTPGTTLTTTDVTKTNVVVLGNVNVSSKSDAAVASIVAGGALGGASAAGAVLVDIYSNSTTASILGGTVNAANVSVKADTNNQDNGLTVAGAAGGIGIGAAFAIVKSDSTTSATIGDSTGAVATNLNVASSVNDQATVEDTFLSLAVAAGAGGTAGVAGMANVVLIGNTTTAGIYSTAIGQQPNAVTPVDTTNPANSANTIATSDYTSSGRLSTPVGNINVSAGETVNATGDAGALGVGISAVGIGAGASVADFSSNVSATVFNSNINSTGTVGVNATASRTVDDITAVAGVGGSTGIGGAVGAILLGPAGAGDTPSDLAGTISNVNTATTDTSRSQSDASLNTSQQTTVQNGTVTAVADTGGLDGISATVEKGNLNAGTLNVTAAGLTSTSNTVGTLAIGGGAAIAGGVAYTRIYDVITADIGSGVNVSAGNVSVSANMGDGSAGSAADVNSYGGSGSLLVGVGGWAAEGIVRDTITAGVTGSITGSGASNSAISLAAADTASINTSGLGVAVGAAAVGVVVSQAEKQSQVVARVTEGSSITDFNSLNLSASDSGSVAATGLAASGGVVAGDGVGVTSEDTATIVAMLGAPTQGDALSGTSPYQYASGHSAAVTTFNISGQINVSASDTPQTSSNATGLSIAGLSLGASVSLADVDPTVSALVASGTTFSKAAGSLSVEASTGPNGVSDAAYANAIAGNGGTLIGANATVSTASTESTVTASVGDNVTLPDGDILIQATNNTQDTAKTTGIAIGGLAAIGLDFSTATSTTNTYATLGTGIVSDTARDGQLQVIADGVDNNIASAIAGAGGAYAGAGAQAETNDQANTLARIAGNGTTETLYALNVVVNATHTSMWDGTSDALAAGLVGASGSIVNNTANSSSLADIGGSEINSTSPSGSVVIHAFGPAANGNAAVVVEAVNTFQGPAETISDPDGTSAEGAAGGVFSGSAAIATTNINGTAQTNIANGVQLYSGSDFFVDPGAIGIAAGNIVLDTDQVTLQTGGAIAGAGVSSNINVGGSNNPLSATVTIGKNVTFSSDGDIGIGTFNQTDVTASALVSTWGLAAVGVANATVNIYSGQSTSIGDGSKIYAFGNINIGSGDENFGGDRGTGLTGSAQAEGYVRALIAIPSADGTSNINNSSTVTIGNADIRSAQDINIDADHGTADAEADGTGHGYELGFIPVTDGSSHPSSSLTSSLAMGGTAIAGIYNNLNVVISCGPDGMCDTLTVNGGAPTQGGNGLLPTAAFPLEALYSNAFNPYNYVSQTFSGASATDLAVLLNGVADSNVNVFELGELYARGGNITISSDSVSGNAKLIAQGSPTITVTNNAPDYLVVGNVQIDDVLGGQIEFVGGATAANAISAGWSLTPNINPTGVDTKTVTISNTYSSFIGTPASGGSEEGPGILLVGTINNLGGDVTLQATDGSFGSVGSINALLPTLNFSAGNVLIANPGGTEILGSSPVSQWANFMIWPGGNPTNSVLSSNAGNLAIEYVANYVADNAVASGQASATDSPGSADYITGILIGQAGQTSHLNAGLGWGTPTGNSPASLIFYGVCEWYSNTCDTGDSEANALSPNGSGHYNLADDDRGSYANIPTVSLSKIATSYSQASNGTVLDPSTGQPVPGGALIFGGQVAITAGIIDIAGSIVVGRPTSFSVDLPASLLAAPTTNIFGQLVGGGAIGVANAQYARGQLGNNPIVDITSSLSSLKAGDALIDVMYNAQTQQIIVTNTQAGSTGAFISLDGGIIGTNTLGNIHVNGGLGTVQVNNETPFTVQLNNITTGSVSANGQLSATVDIIDTFKPAASQQTLLQYIVTGQGQPTTLDTWIGAGSTSFTNLEKTTPTSVSTGNTYTYNPQSGLVYTYGLLADLTRDISSNDNPWLFVNPATGQTEVNATNPWVYVNPSQLYYYSSYNGASSSNGVAPSALAATYSGTIYPGNESATTPQACIGTAANCGVTALSSGQVFAETITATYSAQGVGTWGYEGCGGNIGDGCHYGFTSTYYDSGLGQNRAAWNYTAANSAQILLTNVVRADNAVPITFVGGSEGSVLINSDAPIILNGQILNPNGNTVLNATGSDSSITQAAVSVTAVAKGAAPATTITSTNLTLDATGAIGSTGVPIIASLQQGTGVLNATGGSDGISLALNGGALIGSVQSKTPSNVSYGDVSIVATGSLTAASPNSGNVNVAGRNINITSTQGSIGTAPSSGVQGAPLVIQATPGQTSQLNNGTVTVLAATDVNIVQPSGNLLVNQIGSTSGGGSVSVTAQGGAILDASGLTASGSLSQTQIDGFWAALHLTAADGAVANATATSVVPLINAVNSNYDSFWKLLADGSLTNNAYTGSTYDGSITLSNAGIAALTPVLAATLPVGTTITSNEVQAYANQQLTAIASQLNAEIGTSWVSMSAFDPSGAFSPTFNYATLIPASTVNALTASAVWTTGELTSAIAQQALQPAPALVPIGSYSTANIFGKNVTLAAASSVGNLAAPIDITQSDLTSGTLTQAQQGALALATSPGDVTLTWMLNSDPVTLNLSGPAPVWTDTVTHQVLAVDPKTGVPTGVTLTNVSVNQVAPLFVEALNNLTITAGTNAAIETAAGIFVQSQKTLPLSDVDDTTGAVSLATLGSILPSGNTTGVANIVTGGGLTLNTSGGIGTSLLVPLTYSINGTGQLASVSAATNAFLDQVSGNVDLLGKFFAGGIASIAAPQGSIFEDPSNSSLAISGNTIDLTALNSVGSSAKPIEVNNGSGGVINATAQNGNIYLTDPGAAPAVVGAELNIATANAPHGLVQIGSSINANFINVNATGGISLTVAGDATISPNASITGSSLNFTGGSLTADATSQITAQGDVLITTYPVATSPNGTLGQVVLGNVTSKATSGIGIDVVSQDTLGVLGNIDATGSSISLVSAFGQSIAGSITTPDNLSIVATGNTLQTAGSISASTLEVDGPSASFILADTTNKIGSLAASVGTLDLASQGGLAITTLKRPASSSLAAQTDTSVIAQANFTIDAEPLNGTAGLVTESVPFTVQGLILQGAGADFELTLPGNILQNLQGSTGVVNLASNQGFLVNGITATTSATLATQRTVGAFGSISTPLLTLNGTTATYNLGNVNNAVGTLQTGTGGVTTLNFRDDGGMTLGSIVASNEVTLQSHGTVTQTDVLDTPTLTLAGLSGTFQLASQDNQITTVNAAAGSLFLRDDNGAALNNVVLTGELSILANNATVTESANGLNATLLNLQGNDVNFQFNTANNNIAEITGNTGTLAIRDDQGFTIGSLVASNSVTIQSEGTVGENGSINALSLNLVSLTDAANFNLAAASNQVSNFSATGNNVSFRGDRGFVITGADVTGRLSLTSQSNVAQNGAIQAATLSLNGINGSYTLNRFQNTVGTLTGAASNIYLWDGASLNLGSVNVLNTLGLKVNANGHVTESGAGISATTLSVAGNNATYDLSTAPNFVNIIKGITGTVLYQAAPNAPAPDTSNLLVSEYVAN